MKYRPEIDGLRAFAILPVLFYHAGYKWMPGGWLGVDVFFVISGFLITGILLREIDNRTFSLLKFYERRVRRILPALTVVVLATLAVAPIFMWPWQLAELGQSAIATALFAANVFFDAQDSYFRPNAELYPLIHMWSLAIEEQYYLLLPVLMLLLRHLGLGTRGLFITLAIFCGLSLAGAWLIASREPSIVFYLLPFRIYELGLGSLAAFVAYRGWILHGLVAQVATGLGLAAIAFGAFFITSTGGDPILRIASLLGAVVILLSLPTKGIAHYTLTHPAIRHIGLISFSLYLWHQPILVFARFHFGEQADDAAPLLLLLSTVLAAITWRYVEQPCRKNPAPRKAIFLAASCALLVTISVGSLFALYPRSVARDIFNDTDLSISIKDRVAYTTSGFNARALSKFSNLPGEKVLLIGDSYAQDLYNMAMEVGAFKRAELIARRIDHHCQPYFGDEDVSPFVPGHIQRRCDAQKTDLIQNRLLQDADTVIIAANYKAWFIDHIDDSITELRKITNGEIVLIGSKDFGPYTHLPLRSYLHMTAHERATQRVAVSPSHLREQAQLIASLSALGVSFVDVHAQICRPGSTTCPLFTPQGHLLTYDASHLTQRGAAYAGALVFRLDPLKKYLPTGHAKR